MGILIITHHEQLLEHNRPDFTHVMLGGRIVETGGPELAAEVAQAAATTASGRLSRSGGREEEAKWPTASCSGYRRSGARLDAAAREVDRPSTQSARYRRDTTATDV